MTTTPPTIDARDWRRQIAVAADKSNKHSMLDPDCLDTLVTLANVALGGDEGVCHRTRDIEMLTVREGQDVAEAVVNDRDHRKTRPSSSATLHSLW